MTSARIALMDAEYASQSLSIPKKPIKSSNSNIGICYANQSDGVRIVLTLKGGFK